MTLTHANASNTFTVRSVFIIGPDKKLKLTFTYPAAIVRNFNEILRVIDALPISAEYSISSPAGWNDSRQLRIESSSYLIFRRCVHTVALVRLLVLLRNLLSLSVPGNCIRLGCQTLYY